MPRKTFRYLVLLLLLATTACQGMATPTGSQPADETSAPSVNPTRPAAASVDGASTMACTVVSQETENPDSPIPAVDSGDWIKGAENASLTIIEYSDFQ